MRVLLINPRIKIWNTPTQIPLGLAYLAASLEKAGFEVEVYDAMVESGRLSTKLKKGHFGLVGISATTASIKNAWQLAARVKRYSSALVVLGGPHASAMPAESLAQPGVDLVIRGEGEVVLVALARALAAKKSWRSLPGVCYRRGNNVIQNPLSPLIADLNKLPLPAYHLFKLDRYGVTQPLRDRAKDGDRAFYIMTSRGCPFNCVYCFKGVFGRSWRPRSVTSVIGEWRYLAERLGATEIGVQDDVFNLDRTRALAICDQLIKTGLNRVPWVTNNGMRADKTDLTLLRKMKAAGCKRVAFGVESGSQKILNRIDKQITLGQIRRAFRLAKKVGLPAMGFFMFGNPGETEATMETTIKFAQELDPETAHFSIATPFPGTRLYEEVIREGELLNQDWDDYGILEGKGFFNLGEVTPVLVERKWHEAYRRFYLRPGRIWREMTRLDNWLNWRLLWSAGKRYFFHFSKRN